MHELAVAESVLDNVSAHTGGSRVTVVRLRIGRLSGVEPDSLRFCFGLVTDGTPLDGAELVIEEPGGRLHCEDCGRDIARDDPILLCPCGSADVRVVSGRELQLISVEVV
ncbi:hydrogenase maturation nickel metallochaperone HypA/HybF [Tsukamurella soli]|uniref:Hydrogenase maturation factor HypA n=1 Tax=Tsukamurella soli TaxID=644556 RepID=A0ABP8JFB1_9ACTN